MTLSEAAGRKAVLVFGASGHAKVVMDVIEKSGVFFVSAVADDNPALKGTSIYGYTVMGGRQELSEQRLKLAQAVVAIGHNRIRTDVAAWLESNGYSLCAAVFHPSAQVARGVCAGEGTVVMAGALINSDARIGRNVIVNTGAIVDHDCVIGDGVHVAPGVTMCGGIKVGERTLIGAGAVLHPNVRVGRDVTIGAGATVLGDVQDGLTVTGTPAKPLRK